jgi:alkylation response protein AidB-like acyl-CoA dehydrogenase
VPRSNLIGKQGNGFAEALYLFNTNRVSIAAQAVGFARSALEESKHRTSNQGSGKWVKKLSFLPLYQGLQP